MKLNPAIKGAVLILILTILGAGATFMYRMGNNVGYAPEQPIPFSHKIHAGINEIPCLYCHSSADKSKSATIPSLNVCMNCHIVVKTDSPFIKDLKKHYDEGKSIEWVKVHDNADFVTFNHKRHVLKGVACETCHGNVKQMDKIQQVETLSMGFCVNCHRENNAPIDCSTCHN